MKKAYKETFDQFAISDNAVNHIIRAAGDTDYRDLRPERRVVHRFAFALFFAALLCALTIPVLATEGIDLLGVFKGMFGDKTEIVQESIFLPDINVVENRFRAIDIRVTGIAGDENLLYIMIDVSKKDGTRLGAEWGEESGFCYARIGLKRLSEAQEMNDHLREDIGEDADFIDYGQGVSQWWVRLEDDHPRDNTVTLALIVDIETVINGEEYYVPGETCTLELGSFREKPDTVPIMGLWRAEFVADYQPPGKITKEVHKEAKLPEWGTSDPFTRGFTLGRFELTPFALRYHCDDYDEYINATDDTWICIYVEMNDGSTVGYKTFDSYIERLWNYKSLFLSSGGDMRLNGEIIQENSSLMIFHKPIDLDEVKAVHFGDLTVPID